MKNIRIFYLKIFHFCGGKVFSIFEQSCFRIDCRTLTESVTIVVHVKEQRLSRADCANAHAHLKLRCLRMV